MFQRCKHWGKEGWIHLLGYIAMLVLYICSRFSREDEQSQHCYVGYTSKCVCIHASFSPVVVRVNSGPPDQHQASIVRCLLGSPHSRRQGGSSFNTNQYTLVQLCIKFGVFSRNLNDYLKILLKSAALIHRL